MFTISVQGVILYCDNITVSPLLSTIVSTELDVELDEHDAVVIDYFPVEDMTSYISYCNTGIILSEDVFNVDLYDYMGHGTVNIMEKTSDIEYCKIRMMEQWIKNNTTAIQTGGLKKVYDVAPMMGPMEGYMKGLKHCYIYRSPYNNDIDVKIVLFNRDDYGVLINDINKSIQNGNIIGTSKAFKFHYLDVISYTVSMYSNDLFHSDIDDNIVIGDVCYRSKIAKYIYNNTRTYFTNSYKELITEKRNPFVITLEWEDTIPNYGSLIGNMIGWNDKIHVKFYEEDGVVMIDKSDFKVEYLMYYASIHPDIKSIYVIMKAPKLRIVM